MSKEFLFECFVRVTNRLVANIESSLFFCIPFIEMREKLQQRRDDDLRPSESSCVGCISIDLLGGCSVSCLLINSVKAAFTAQCVEELS